ncbi:hypothetical protein WJX84_008390 [Apatococcus fuscideae]|uniref:Uncharacterized protein n=1 Tax=Apatococcus fuscideae TaxID=2026836 RepID=A0AAW1SXK5_9CHLO
MPRACWAFQPSLIALDLGECSLPTLPAAVIALQRLKELNLCHNELTNLPSGPYLTGLELLDVNTDQFSLGDPGEKRSINCGSDPAGQRIIIRNLERFRSLASAQQEDQGVTVSWRSHLSRSIQQAQKHFFVDNQAQAGIGGAWVVCWLLESVADLFRPTEANRLLPYWQCYDLFDPAYAGDLEVVQLILPHVRQNFKAYRLLWEIVMHAKRSAPSAARYWESKFRDPPADPLALAEWLAEQHGTFTWDEQRELRASAASSGSLVIMQLAARSRQPHILWNPAMLGLAAAQGDLTLLKWVLSLKASRILPAVLALTSPGPFQHEVRQGSACATLQSSTKGLDKADKP